MIETPLLRVGSGILVVDQVHCGAHHKSGGAHHERLGSVLFSILVLGLALKFWKMTSFTCPYSSWRPELRRANQPSLLVFSSLGGLLCVLVKEVFEAQTLPNLPRFIMVFLCGIVYPVSAMPPALQRIAYLKSLTYTVDGLRLTFSPISEPSDFLLSSFTK